MTLSERNNYRIAVSFSILLHVGLCLIYFPVGFQGGKAKVETYSAGLIDMSSGTQPLPKSGGEAEQKAIETGIPAKPDEISQSQAKLQTVPQPKLKTTELKLDVKPQPEVKGETKPAPLSETKTVSKSTAKVAGNPDTRPNSPTTPAPSHDGEARGGKPASKPLGDGSGMVSEKGLSRLIYPKDAMNEGKEGEVLVRALLTRDGSLKDVEIVNSSGDGRFDKVAVAFVKKAFKFNPNKENYQVDILFSFQKANKYQPTYKFVGSQTRP